MFLAALKTCRDHACRERHLQAMTISRKLTAHEVQCVATISYTDPRTVRSFLADPERVRSKCAARIEMALVEIGVVDPGRAPVQVRPTAARVPGAGG